MEWTCTRLNLAIQSLLVVGVVVTVVLLHLRFRALCSHGFLACGRVGLDLLYLAHIVRIVSLLLVLLGHFITSTDFLSLILCDSVAFCAATSVAVSTSRLTSVELVNPRVAPRCLFASSSSRYLAVP